MRRVPRTGNFSRPSPPRSAPAYTYHYACIGVEGAAAVSGRHAAPLALSSPSRRLAAGNFEGPQGAPHPLCTSILLPSCISAPPVIPLIRPLRHCFGAGRRSGGKPRRPCFPAPPRWEAFLFALVRQVHGIPALPHGRACRGRIPLPRAGIKVTKGDWVFCNNR